MLSLLGVDYPFTHGWSNEGLVRIAEQIRKRKLLDRLRSQGVYWARASPVSYCSQISGGFSTSQLNMGWGKENSLHHRLFEEKEAQLAVEHAEGIVTCCFRN